MIVFESPMLEFINEQHYHGLAQTGDMETPAKLKKGMSGIATCYEKELFQQGFVTNTRPLLFTASASFTFPFLRFLICLFRSLKHWLFFLLLRCHYFRPLIFEPVPNIFNKPNDHEDYLSQNRSILHKSPSPKHCLPYYESLPAY